MDEGLPLETSVLETLYCDQFILSTKLIKPNYLKNRTKPPLYSAFSPCTARRYKWNTIPSLGMEKTFTLATCHFNSFITIAISYQTCNAESKANHILSTEVHWLLVQRYKSLDNTLKNINNSCKELQGFQMNYLNCREIVRESCR